MFNDPGDKIKKISIAWFIILTIASVILAFALGIDSYRGFCAEYFFPLLIGGPLFAYVSGLLLYGFGELVEGSAPHPFRQFYTSTVNSTQSTTTHTSSESSPTETPVTTMTPADTPDLPVVSNMTASEVAAFALKYSTDKGMEDYLKSELPKLRESEKTMLTEAADLKGAELREALKKLTE